MTDADDELGRLGGRHRITRTALGEIYAGRLIRVRRGDSRNTYVCDPLQDFMKNTKEFSHLSWAKRVHIIRALLDAANRYFIINNKWKAYPKVTEVRKHIERIQNSAKRFRQIIREMKHPKNRLESDLGKDESLELNERRLAVHLLNKFGDLDQAVEALGRVQELANYHLEALPENPRKRDYPMSELIQECEKITEAFFGEAKRPSRSNLPAGSDQEGEYQGVWFMLVKTAVRMAGDEMSNVAVDKAIQRYRQAM